jgi:hypothetical protein
MYDNGHISSTIQLFSEKPNVLLPDCIRLHSGLYSYNSENELEQISANQTHAFY